MEIAGHEIGAAEVDNGIASIGENIDATVFEIAVDNTAHVDVFAQSRDARAKAAHSTNQKLNGDALLRAGVEGLNDLGVDEGIGFDKDARRSTGAMMSRFPMDMFEEAGRKVERGDEEFIEVGGLGHSGEDIEERGDFGG